MKIEVGDIVYINLNPTIRYYREVGLNKPSVIDCYQVRTVSIDRILENKLGNAIELIDDVKKRLAGILEITEEHVV